MNRRQLLRLGALAALAPASVASASSTPSAFVPPILTSVTSVTKPGVPYMTDDEFVAWFLADHDARMARAFSAVARDVLRQLEDPDPLDIRF